MSISKNGFRAVARRECERMVSRPIYLAMTLIVPLICYAFFTTLLHDGLPEQMPVGVVDLDNSSTSRLLVRQIDASQQSQVVAKVGSFHEAQKLLQEGRVYAFVVIPENFQADVMSGRQPEVPFYSQNAYFIAGSLLMKDLSTTLASVSGGINLKMRMAKGEQASYAMAQVQAIVPNTIEMGNPWTNYSVYLSTTMLPGMLQLTILISTVFCVGIELKQKTSREWISVSRNSILKALAGKMLPYTVIFLLLVFLCNALLFDYLKFPFNGSKWQMTLGSILFVLAQQGLGLFIIGLIPVLRDSLSICAILGTLAISFSGLTFPIEGFLSGIQAWNIAFPLRHYFLIYVSQALTGGEMATSWAAYLSLLVFILLPLTVMIRLKKALVRQNFPVD